MVALDEQFHHKGKGPQRGRRRGGQSARSMRPVVRSTADIFSGWCRRDKCGAIVEAYDTDAYGSTLIFTGPGADGMCFTDDDVQSNYRANSIIYCGYRYDPETENYYVRNRYYSPLLGRGVIRGPIGHEGGVNLYEYAGGWPSLQVDPSGAAPVAPDPCPCPKGYKSMGKFTVTAYGPALEADFPVDKKIAWPVLKGLRRFAFIRAVVVNGMGVDSAGAKIQIDWPLVPKYAPKHPLHYVKEFATKSGRGAVAGTTIAVDPAVIALGKWVHIATMGWRRADDTGGKIKGKHY